MQVVISKPFGLHIFHLFSLVFILSLHSLLTFFVTVLFQKQPLFVFSTFVLPPHTHIHAHTRYCISLLSFFFAEIERCVGSLSLLSLPNCFILLCITLCFEPFRTVSKCRIAVICVLLSYSCFAFALFLYFCFIYLFLLSIALPCCSILFYLLIFSIFSNYRQIRVVGRREEHLFVKTVSQPVSVGSPCGGVQLLFTIKYKK